MFREVHMIEVKEVLRLWRMGHGIRRTSELTGLDRKTVRRYRATAEELGLGRDGGEIGDAEVGALIASVRPDRRGQGRGHDWERLESQRGQIQKWLTESLTLTKIHSLLRRRGVDVNYRTLHRFCVAEFDLGRPRETVPVADGPPGHEVQADFGRLGYITMPSGKRRLVRGLALVAVVSRHLFCWPTFGESLPEIIEGFEAAWTHFQGVFRIVIVDNLAAVVTRADPLHPLINPVFQEYAQARGFIVDPCEVRSPTQKPRVERQIPYCRQSGFQGEDFRDLLQVRRHFHEWGLQEAGLRTHRTTRRRPLEHFREVEQPHLLPKPETPFDIPTYAKPTVARDHHVAVCLAVYSVPGNRIGQVVDARADSKLIKISQHGQLLRVHERKPPGGRSTFPEDLPAEKRGYAMRDIEYLKRVAAGHGEQIAIYVSQLLEGPLPWSRMRQVYRLLGLVKRFGAEAVEAACRRCLEHDVVDVTRVKRIVERALERRPDVLGSESGTILRPRFARNPNEFAPRRRQAGEPELDA